MFLEFFDGVLGHYTFESDKVNVLIGGLPSLAYPLGQVIFLVLAYWLFIHRYLKSLRKCHLRIFGLGIKRRSAKVNYLSLSSQ